MLKKFLIVSGICFVAALAYAFNVSKWSVGVSIRYDLEFCRESEPLRVTVINRSVFPIQSYGLSAQAKKPGYSDTKRGEVWAESTKIIPRWSSYSQCLATDASRMATSGEKSLFQSKIDASHLEERDLIWSASIYGLRFLVSFGFWKIMMRLSEFFVLDGEYQISADDVQMLNMEFSRASIEDIPSDKVSATCEYLCAVLLHSAVDPEIHDNLAELLAALQDKTEPMASSRSS